jgi:hypothetical protein
MQITCTLAGASFRPAESKQFFRDQAAIGHALTLEPDGDNEYDPQAVRVMFADHHIGFIPRDSNGPIFSALTDGDEVIATIIAFEAPLRPVLEINL